MNIDILLGSENFSITNCEVTVVIDVIRAFTTSEVAFSKGVKEIVMVKEVEQAFMLKNVDPNLLLMGEVDALPIKGFDLDNSPWRMQQSVIDLNQKTLVQRTTNGVKAVVNNFNSNHTLVTGFSNAFSTAKYLTKFNFKSISLIASHPTSDEDLACADYIKALVEKKVINADEIAQRIRNSAAAQKFFKGNQSFLAEDIELSSIEKRSNQFVMAVNNTDHQLTMTKHPI